MSEQYSSQIIRNPELEDGPGQWTIYLDDEPVACFPCITGDEILDPREYGGICPPVKLVMCSEIHVHTERGRSPMDFCRVMPLDYEETKRLYPKRTWESEGAWFKFHQMGRSSGCSGPPRRYWDYAKGWLNKAYQHSKEHGYDFVTEVCDFKSA